VPTNELARAHDEQRAAIETIVTLAASDLPAAAGLAQVARMSRDDEVAHAMLRRVYMLALDAEDCYLAELVDDVLRRIESTGAFVDPTDPWR
jgi:hypothetical protein